jgi:hypothetical protein
MSTDNEKELRRASADAEVAHEWIIIGGQHELVGSLSSKYLHSAGGVNAVRIQKKTIFFRGATCSHQ